MQPSTETRYYGTKRNSVFGVVLVLAILVVLAVVFVEIAAVAAICALLVVWILIYNGTQAFLRLSKGPKAYAVDATGVWRGRGGGLKPLFEWKDLTSWQGFSTSADSAVSGTCEFRAAGRRVLISSEDVARPSTADFALQVLRFVPFPPEDRSSR